MLKKVFKIERNQKMLLDSFHQIMLNLFYKKQALKIFKKTLK
jgi:hypothetical protein